MRRRSRRRRPRGRRRRPCSTCRDRSEARSRRRRHDGGGLLFGGGLLLGGGFCWVLQSVRPAAGTQTNQPCAETSLTVLRACSSHCSVLPGVSDCCLVARHLVKS